MTKFHYNELFCTECLTHDTFFKGGNSWGIDHCPECGNMECTLYSELTLLQKHIAKSKFNKMWDGLR